MALFNFHFDRPGPGVSPDAPRKKGPARFFEILGRDLMSFYLAGLLALVSALPFVFGVWFAVDTHSLVPLLLAGVLGGMIAAPQLCGLLDTILRSLRDEPGFWWATYRRAWKRNAKASLLPGAICGLLLAMQIFTVFHYDVSAGVVPGALLAVGLFLLLGLGEFLFAQVVLLELPFAGLVKNSLFLFLGYLPRAALGVVWQFVYWSIILLLWPISGFAMVLTGLWLPAVLTMQAIYPVLNKAFDLERQIKAIRDAELDSSSDSDNYVQPYGRHHHAVTPFFMASFH